MSHTATTSRVRVTRRQREAIQKVRAWHSWQIAGGDPRTRPAQPSRRDYVAARSAEL